MRSAGVPVGTGRIELLARAAADAPADLYWAGRAVLVSRRDDIAVYDQAFAQTFGPETIPALRTTRTRAISSSPFDARSGNATNAAPPVSALASPTEVLRRKSFSRCSEEELRELYRLMQRLRLRGPVRRRRRREAGRRGQPDLRRTLRAASRAGGEPIDRFWRRRRERRRRVVFIVDVSGSMAVFTRALLLFAHAALNADSGSEAFAFGTRLTRLTAAFAESGPDAALARAAERDTDWDGGTRIGESIGQLLAEYDGLVRGAVIVVLSDGLDLGDPDRLRDEMARLARLSYRIVWLNPLKENPDYAPLARGMRAALPAIDHFDSGHDFSSLERLAAEIAGLPR